MAEINSVNSNPEPQAVPQRPKHSAAKRILVALVVVLFALGAIAGGAYIITQDKGSKDDSTLKYAPWTDLGEHYDLSCVNLLEGDVYHFNSHELGSSRVPLTGYRPSDEGFEATVLGTGVWIRSYPKLKNRTKLCQVKTGDQLSVIRQVGFMEGKHWYYVQVKSGRRAGYEGYICADYVIEQEGYDLLQRYVLGGNSNLNIKSPVKYLRALSTILLRLGVPISNANISVQMLDTAIYDYHTIVTFQIRDLNVAENGSLLAFVQYMGDDEDFVVIGVVPGNEVNSVMRSQNYSFDVYYY